MCDANTLWVPGWLHQYVLLAKRIEKMTGTAAVHLCSCYDDAGKFHAISGTANYRSDRARASYMKDYMTRLYRKRISSSALPIGRKLLHMCSGSPFWMEWASKLESRLCHAAGIAYIRIRHGATSWCDLQLRAMAMTTAGFRGRRVSTRSSILERNSERSQNRDQRIEQWAGLLKICEAGIKERNGDGASGLW